MQDGSRQTGWFLRPKISYGFGGEGEGGGEGHCNLCHPYARSVDFVYFVIPILWSRPFLMSLMNFSFMLSGFQQNLSHLIIEQIPTMLDFKLVESNQFKVDIKSRTWLA